MITNKVKCASCDTYAVFEVDQKIGNKTPPCKNCGKDTVLVLQIDNTYNW